MSSFGTTGVPVKFRCDFGIIETIGQVIIWILLSIVTLGLALLVFPYYFNKAVLNRTEVVDSNGRSIGKLDCQFNLGSSIGHLIVWTLLIIVTLGIAAFFYAYRILRVLINDTRIVYY
jgi:membrane protein YdbS with pleckstrin-like domain